MWLSTSTILYPSFIAGSPRFSSVTLSHAHDGSESHSGEISSLRHNQRLETLARLQQFERLQSVIQIIAMRHYRFKIDRAARHGRDCAPPGLGRAHARRDDADAVKEERAQFGPGDVARRPSKFDHRATLAHDM